jgi:hypothetical protein
VSSKLGHLASADTVKIFNLPLQGMTKNAVRHALGRVGLAVGNCQSSIVVRL